MLVLYRNIIVFVVFVVYFIPSLLFGGKTMKCRVYIFSFLGGTLLIKRSLFQVLT